MYLRIISWPLAPLSIIAIAIALFAAHTRLEGPVLVPISPGHALSALDSFALLPLLIGVAWLYGGLWQRRQRLGDLMLQSSRVSGGALFITGLGLGLLVASSFSAFFWWWAIGAILFSAMIIAAVIVVAQQ